MLRQGGMKSQKFGQFGVLLELRCKLGSDVIKL